MSRRLPAFLVLPGAVCAQRRARTYAAILVAGLLFFTACGGHKQTAKVSVPPPPSIPTPQTQSPAPVKPPVTAKPTKPVPAKPPTADADTADEEDKEALAVPPDTKPLEIQEGLASWYGPPYHNRKGSNGEIYNMHAMTAAHRTLPLGSLVRVTNVKTGSSAIVRITDRGPFIDGRIIDLSLAAAKKVDVWRAGVTSVRLEVLKTPSPLTEGGRWAVQIGSFAEEDPAREVADRVTRRYRTAKVLCFNSPVGDWWVRIRVKDDDRKRAEEVAHDTQTSQGSIFLVRLD